MNRIAIIILNYNSFSDCKDCIESIRLQTGIDYEIVVVDNCSCSEDAEQVKALCQKYNCSFIAAGQNRGYSAGNNVGLRYATSMGYEYLAIVNPDMIFPRHDYFNVLVFLVIVLSAVQSFAKSETDCANGTWGGFSLEVPFLNDSSYYEIDTPEKLAWVSCRTANEITNINVILTKKVMDYI